MGTGEQKLTIKTQLEGGKQTADGLKDISAAQEKVTSAHQQTGTATQAANESQENLNASEGDYIQLLAAISPRLGAFSDAAIKASKVVGDLASQNINLASAFKKTKAAIAGNAKSLKLLLAGGAAVAGLLLVAKAFEAIKREAEQATQAINGTIEARTRLRGEELNRKQAIEDIADKRREGGFTAAEARQAEQRALRIKETNPALQDGAVNQAVALGGPDRSKDELAKIAFLLQSGRLDVTGDQRQGTRDRIIERSLERNADVIEKAFNREGTQAKERLGVAQTQANSAVGGNQAELIEIIKKFTDGTNINPEDVAKIVQVLPAADRNRGKTLKGIPINSIFANAERTRVEDELADAGLDTSGRLAPSQRSINVARQVLTTINNNQGATFNGSDAEARRQRETASGMGESGQVLAEN